MNNILNKIFNFFIIFLCISCSTNEKIIPAEDALDAVRLFKDAYQNGNYEKAKFYCLDNESNKVKLDSIFKNYQSLSNAEKTQLKSASLIILKNETMDEQSVQIILANKSSVNNDTFKVVKLNNIWQINLSK